MRGLLVFALLIVACAKQEPSATDRRAALSTSSAVASPSTTTGHPAPAQSVWVAHIPEPDKVPRQVSMGPDEEAALKLLFAARAPLPAGCRESIANGKRDRLGDEPAGVALHREWEGGGGQSPTSRFLHCAAIAGGGSGPNDRSCRYEVSYSDEPRREVFVDFELRAGHITSISCP